MPAPALPATRVLYDLDGSTLFAINTSGVITTATNPQAKLCNGEGLSQWNASSANTTGITAYLGVMFSEPRNLRGIHASFTMNQGGNHLGDTHVVQVSKDTTNGSDGTWTNVASNPTWTLTDYTGTQGWRDKVSVIAQSTTTDGVKAVRVGIRASWSGNWTLTVHRFHIYADADPAATDTVEAWHPTLDQPLGNIDFGDVARGSTGTATFRVKNSSATKSCGTITAAIDEATATTPTQASQYALSVGGGAYAATITTPGLAPGAISPVITLRRQISTTATLGSVAVRVSLTPASWT